MVLNMKRLYRVKLTPNKNNTYFIHDMNEMREIPDHDLYSNFELDEVDVAISENLVKRIVIYKYKRNPNMLFIDEDDYTIIFLNDFI